LLYSRQSSAFRLNSSFHLLSRYPETMARRGTRELSSPSESSIYDWRVWAI
jgi:hypothetical protein